jgi:hypothetical protein
MQRSVLVEVENEAGVAAETFDNVHGATAYRTTPERMSVVSRRRRRQIGCLLRASEQMEIKQHVYMFIRKPL